MFNEKIDSRNPEPRLATPLLATDEPICETGKLACGNGDCIDKELFCNGAPDCADGSDENACSESSITLCNTLSTTKLWKNFFQKNVFLCIHYKSLFALKNSCKTFLR